MELAAVAVKPMGVDGAVASGTVVTLALLEFADWLPALSTARTEY